MHPSIRRAIANLTIGEDSDRHFNLAAERIQHALLDVLVPTVSGAEMGLRAEPARLVGGDYIDIFGVAGNQLVIGLGDASGKSLAAALNALMLRYLVRGLITALGTEQLISIVTHTNAVVTDDMSEGSFITFLLAAFDLTSGTLRVVNAGHEPPLVYRSDSNEVETMDVHDIVLGIETQTAYKEQQTILTSGDVAVLYTDGLTEATNSDGELFTIKRLKDALQQQAGLSAQHIAETIFDAVKDYSDGPLRDDATIFVLRRTD